MAGEATHPIRLVAAGDSQTEALVSAATTLGRQFEMAPPALTSSDGDLAATGRLVEGNGMSLAGGERPLETGETPVETLRRSFDGAGWSFDGRETLTESR